MRLVFDGFEIDPEGCQLLRAGVEVPLEPRALDLLCYLAARPGQLIRKDELLTHVWRARTLSDGVLANTVGKLRRALGQSARKSSPIETVHGRGYRWRALAHEAVAPSDPVARPARPSTDAQSVTGSASADPFVGRGSVLVLLSNALEQTALGAGGLIAIVGDAGIGKTRTLAQLSERARARGFSVWSGSAYDGAGAPAYWPWVEILRAARNELDEPAWRRHLPHDPRALALVVPELIDTAPAATSDAHSARFRLFDEVTRLLASASREAARLIVLDDLHWADVATLELLVFAARALAKQPVLFAVGLRERDAVASPLHVASLRRLDRIATRISLSGLEVSEVAQLVAALDGAAPADARLHESLHRRTQGNPFFIRQILALLAQRAPRPEATTVDSIELPPAVHDVIRQRIESLGAANRDVLAAAAVIGHEFDAPLLASVVDLTLEDTLSAMEPARELGVVERSRSTPHRFQFSHTLLRDVLYAELGWARCGALHFRVAHALAARPLRDDARHLGAVARHYLLAVPSQLDSSVRACTLAATAAREAAGFEAAADLLSRALEKLVAERGDEDTCCALLLTLGFDQLCSGDLVAAWQTLARGAKLADETGRADVLAGFACRMADWLEFGGDEYETRRRLDQALARVPADKSDLHAALLARRAKVHHELPASERAALLDRAEELAQRCGLPNVRIDVAFCRANLRDPSRLEEGRAAVAQFRALVQQYPAASTGIRDEMRRVVADVTEYFIELTAGELAAADRAAARWSAAVKEFQVSALRTIEGLMVAGRALADGRLADLEAGVQRRIESGSELAGAERGFFLYLVLLADARGELSGWSGVVLPELAAARPGELGSHQHVALAIWSAWLYARTGRLDEARATLRSMQPQWLARMPVLHGDLGLLCMLAETYRELADRAGARRVGAQLAPHAGRNAVGALGECWGSVAYYLGLLALLLDDPREAVRQLEQAERKNLEWRMPLQVVRTRALLAQCRAGDAAVAQDS